MSTAGCYALELAQLPSHAVLRLLRRLIMEREPWPKSSFLPTRNTPQPLFPGLEAGEIGAMAKSELAL